MVIQESRPRKTRGGENKFGGKKRDCSHTRERGPLGDDGVSSASPLIHSTSLRKCCLQELKWVGALPDAITTVRRKDPSLLNTVFPKVIYV